MIKENHSLGMAGNHELGIGRKEKAGDGQEVYRIPGNEQSLGRIQVKRKQEETSLVASSILSGIKNAWTQYGQ